MNPETASPKIKLAVVTSYFPTAEENYRGHTAVHTLRHMPEDVEIRVFSPHAEYPRPKWLNPRGFRYHRPTLNFQPAGFDATYFSYPAIPMVTRPVNGVVCAHYLKRFLVEYRPDVILNYWIYPEGFSALRVGKKLGIPVIVGSIGSDLRRIDFITRRLVQYTLQRAAAVITVSEELRQRAIGMGVPPGRVTTIVNGFDSTVFHPGDRAAARRKLGVPEDAELILFTGSIAPAKGVLELTEAMIALRASRPRLQVAMIGEGGSLGEMKQRLAQAGCPELFRFLGQQKSDGVAAWMTACDVFCLPSHSEGCPNVVVEALASGRPVVSTLVGGIPDMVNEECGILIEPQDAAKLREAIDLALGRSIGDANNRWDAERISKRINRTWQDAARETYEVCCRVLNRPVDAPSKETLIDSNR